MTPAQSAISGRPLAVRTTLILGTAGHIDHGKSALVTALTGTDPDRLPEEQARGMTIELGFARMVLPDPDGSGGALHVGIVDVPGHERFVKTMVAGATGIDLAMLVVAADDGVMPQTREHIDILDLLGVRAGLVAVSKADLVVPERIDAVRSQIAELTRGTNLEHWSAVPCSAKSGKGLDDISGTIAALASRLPMKRATGVYRLAIDRVFAIHGRGTVVTGSVLSGSVTPGQTLELLPAGVMCRVREVQSHGEARDIVAAGQRAALNLTGVDREKIERGMELATPGYLAATRYLDARVRMLAARKISAAAEALSRGRANPMHQKVRVCMGTRDVMATLVTFGREPIPPGASGFVQLRMAEPVVAAFGQRFILRNENAQATLGGGVVVRPSSRRLATRDPAEMEALRRAASDDPFVRYEEAMRRSAFAPETPLRIACQIGAPPEEIGALNDRLQREGGFVSVTPQVTVHRDTIEFYERRALAYLQRHHAVRPQEPGLPRDRYIGYLERRSAPGCGRAILKRLERAESVIARGPYVAHRDFRPAMSTEEAALLESLIAEVATAKYDPPAWPQLKTVAPLSKQRAKVLEDVARSDPRLVQIAPQQYISAEALASFRQTVVQLGAGGRFKLADVRDALGLSRRVVQTLLEYLDRVAFTRRVGDERVLVEKSW